MPLTSGKRAFLDVLKQEGVQYMFGNPGTTELPLMDGLADEPALTYVLALQEAAVVAIADGYAQASGKLGVVSVHVAPGLGNALGMLYDAQKAAAPLLVTAGQQDQNINVTEPILSADLRADGQAVREVVGRGAAPRGPAEPGPSRREDRAGAADRPGVPGVAGRHPQEPRARSISGADARRAEDARRPDAVDAAADMLAGRSGRVIMAGDAVAQSRAQQRAGGGGGGDRRAGLHASSCRTPRRFPPRIRSIAAR